jgi:acyl carrier protein
MRLPNKVLARTRQPETDLGLDSLSVVNLVLLIENEFGVTLDPEDLHLDNFQTLDSCAAMLDRALARQRNRGRTK